MSIGATNKHVDHDILSFVHAVLNISYIRRLKFWTMLIDNFQEITEGVNPQRQRLVNCVKETFFTLVDGLILYLIIRHSIQILAIGMHR